MKRVFAAALAFFVLVPYAIAQQGVQAPFYQSSEGLAKGHGWQLRARTLDALTFPVPTLQPLNPGKPIALDLQPLGPNPVESPGNGFTWFDSCNADVMLANDKPVSCARLGIRTINGAAAAYVGMWNYNGAPPGNLWFTTDFITPRWGVTYSGQFIPYLDNTYSLGSPGSRATEVWATNGVIQTSDEREKIDIVPTKLGLSFINNLHPSTYRWRAGKDTSTRHQGVMAQDVVRASGDEPNGVTVGDNGKLQMNYSEMIGPLIKAVQELSAEVQSLKASCR